jgi:RNase H-fold protein (predicted Holliday junction resolvase)
MLPSPTPLKKNPIVSCKSILNENQTLKHEQEKNALFDHVNKELIKNGLPLKFDLHNYSENIVTQLLEELQCSSGYKVTLVDEKHKRNLAIQLLQLYGLSVELPTAELISQLTTQLESFGYIVTKNESTTLDYYILIEKPESDSSEISHHHPQNLDTIQKPIINIDTNALNNVDTNSLNNVEFFKRYASKIKERAIL